MSSNITACMGARQIPDAFMDSGEGYDYIDRQERKYIECTYMVKDGERRGICVGISAGSTNDASGLAVLTFKLRDSAAIITGRFALGMTHYLNLHRLYASDANGVILYY